MRRPTPPGGSTTLTAPIGADGKAAVHYRVKQKDRTGQYQVQAGASFLGFTRSTSTTLMVQ